MTRPQPTFAAAFLLMLLVPALVRAADEQATSSAAPAADRPTAAAAEAPAAAPSSSDSKAESEGKVRLVSGTEAVPAAKATPAAPPAEAPSTAERIARLERVISADEKRLRELRETIHLPGGEYAQAEAAFGELDARRDELKQKLDEAEQSGTTDSWARLQDELKSLEKKWQLAKERFDLAIAVRKASQEALVTLEQKLAGLNEQISKLRGTAEPEKLAQTVTPPDAAPAPSATPATTAPPAAPAAAPAPSLPASPLAAAAGMGTPAAETPPVAAAAPTKPKKVAAELVAASAAAEKSHELATAAEAEAHSLGERIQILQKDIQQQRQMRDMLRKKVDNADETLKDLNAELFRKLMAGEPIDEVKQQIGEATARARDNREKAREISTRLDNMQSAVAHMQAEQIHTAEDAAKKRAAAEQAQATVERLQNPFTLRNVLQWLINHGPRIVVILCGLSMFMWITRMLESRLVALIAHRGRRGSREDRENRAKTLLGVFNNVSNLLVVGVGSVTLLDEIGIPITPVIGGVAVLGLAVAFGAQSLIKDYFTGFMVLLEQQYLINDVVKIGEIIGQVERISLRMTVLRDLEGRVHFVPHGQINSVTNLTHGWSRAVFEIGVAYKENVDRVIEVLTRLATDLRQDDNFRLLILNDPVMLGVDAFASSAVVIKFYIQTRPLQQWKVKREMLRRIKNEFDRLGIEIPFPHVTVYRGMAKTASSASEDGDEQWTRRDVA